jgi:hypothetical protein
LRSAWVAAKAVNRNMKVPQNSAMQAIKSFRTVFGRPSLLGCRWECRLCKREMGDGRVVDIMKLLSYKQHEARVEPMLIKADFERK